MSSRRYSLLAAPLLLLISFFLVPVVVLLSRSFSAPRWGFQNFSALLGAGVYLNVILNTVFIAATATACCIVLGFPVAYTMVSSSNKINRLLMFCVLAPFWTSVLVRSFGWMVILQRQGILNNAMIAMHLIDTPLPLIYNRFGTLVGMVQVLLPFFIFPLYSVMNRISPTYMEAASVLGAGPVKTFLRVYLPLTLNGLYGGATMVFIMALGFYITPVLLGGPRDVMVANLIEQQVSELSNWGMAGALSVVLLGITLNVLALSRFVFGVRDIWKAV